MTPAEASPWVKFLLELGLTPMNIMLAAAVYYVVKWALAKDKSQDEKREAAHAETKAQVQKLSKEAEQCKTDRTQLNRRLTAAERKLDSCTVVECPLRRSKTP